MNDFKKTIIIQRVIILLAFITCVVATLCCYRQDLEIAKEKLKVIDIKFFLNGTTEQSNYIVDKADEINIAIETVLSELEKKEAIINEMAKYMEQEMAEYQLDDIYSELHNCNGMERNWTRGKEAEIKEIKEYFTKKSEKEGK